MTSQSESDDGKEPQELESKAQEAVDDDSDVEVMRDDSSDAHRPSPLKLRQVNTEPSVSQFINISLMLSYIAEIRSQISIRQSMTLALMMIQSYQICHVCQIYHHQVTHSDS